MKKSQYSLLKKLKWTILGLAAAMLAIWLVFFINTRNVIQKYTMDRMEQASQRIISELNDAFLQLEEISFVMAESETVHDFIMTEDNLQFHKKAVEAEKELSGILNKDAIAEDIIIYNNKGKFYRFTGSLSNINVIRLMRRIEQNEKSTHVQITLDGTNYIGYLSSINEDGVEIGKIVMLIDENQVMNLFWNLREDDRMNLSLAADNIILVSSDVGLRGENAKVYMDRKEYRIRNQVGFTPFELLISYEDTNQEINRYFIIAMLFMAGLFLLAVRVFAVFWRKKFFEPIQKVISDVEVLGGGKNEALPMTGLEHFDGLVSGINAMIERIEDKEKELYDTAFSLQKSEIAKQKALIISLKKQISAHFTINILNIIAALSASGNNEQVELLCSGLSNLLRYANAGDSFISGMEEFYVLQKYINIMEIRYQNRFKACIDPEDYLEEIMLPRMLLQPIVENSIVHGFPEKELDKAGMIHIYSILEEDCIRIVVEDNGLGMDTAKLSKLRKDIDNAVWEDVVEVEGLSRVALINIQRRIWSYFGNKYGLEIESEKNKGTKVTVKLPVR